MRNRFVSLLIACLTVLSAPAVRADTITLKADYWMPFNGDGKTETGYMLDIAKAIFEAKGHKVVFVVTPWEKAIAEARAGKCNAIIGAAKDDAPDFVFPPEELGVSVQLFCVKSGTPWKYAGVGSLKTIKLGVIKDYAYFTELDEYIKANPTAVSFATGDTPLQSNLTKVLQGELGATVDDRSVLKYTIAKMNLQGKIVIAAASSDATKSAKLYIAFSPKNPKSKEYAQLLAEGILTLRANGELPKILAKYGLVDWK